MQFKLAALIFSALFSSRNFSPVSSASEGDCPTSAGWRFARLQVRSITVLEFSKKKTEKENQVSEARRKEGENNHNCVTSMFI